MYDAEGKPDKDFIEWYSRADEGTEWRRRTDESLQPVERLQLNKTTKGGGWKGPKKKRRKRRE